MRTIGCYYMDGMYAQRGNLTANAARSAVFAPVTESPAMELILGSDSGQHL